METDDKEPHWTEKASKNLDYYLNTEEGQKELSEMIKKETETQLQELSKSKQGLKEIIWLSKYCNKCSNFIQTKNSMKCVKFDSKIVKPFYGRPLWNLRLYSRTEESFISEINWNLKSYDVADIIIEEAIKKINKGYPYLCFETKETL